MSEEKRPPIEPTLETPDGADQVTYTEVEQAARTTVEKADDPPVEKVQTEKVRETTETIEEDDKA